MVQGQQVLVRLVVAQLGLVPVPALVLVLALGQTVLVEVHSYQTVHKLIQRVVLMELVVQSRQVVVQSHQAVVQTHRAVVQRLVQRLVLMELVVHNRQVVHSHLVVVRTLGPGPEPGLELELPVVAHPVHQSAAGVQEQSEVEEVVA